MRHHLQTIFFFSCLFSLTLSAQMPNSGNIVFSTNSLTPPGMYSVSSLGSDKSTFLFPSNYLTRVVAASYPVISPDGSRFARFETNDSGQKLILRSMTDGSLLRQEAMKDYASNPQWTRNGSLAFETISTSGVNKFLFTDPESGSVKQTVELKNQYYPQSNPGGGSAVLSGDGTHFAFLRYRAGVPPVPNTLTPYHARIPNFAEPCFPPHHSGTVNGSNEEKIVLRCFPTSLPAVRQIALSHDGTWLVLVGSVSYERPYPSDPSKTYTITKTGIIAVSLTKYEINVIYETKDYFVEHPDNLFFSPTQLRFAFTVVVDNKKHIFTANPTSPNSYSDRGIGEFVVGPTSVQSWALNPWSPSGQRLLYRRDQAIWSMPTCGEGSMIHESKGKQLFIQDAQWANASPPEIPAVETSMVNPKPHLLNSDSRITSDVERRIRQGTPIKGITADGAAKIVVLVKLPFLDRRSVSFSLRKTDCASGVTGNPDADGGLSAGFQNGTVATDRIELESSQTTLGNYATFVYHAPLNFVREGTEDDLLTERVVTISAFIDEFRFDIPVRIVRPIVVLLHGIWSDSRIWENFAPLRKINPIARDSFADPRFQCFAIDYYWKCTKSVLKILQDHSGVANQLDELIGRRNSDFATVRADIVAHSLGGIVSRAYPYFFPTRYFEETYHQGKIHKLITNDSPHLGSEFCSMLFENFSKKSSRFTKEYMDKMFADNVFDRPSRPLDAVSGGAVKDLGLNSELLIDLGTPNEVKVQPPLHTIVSIASPSQISANDGKVFKVALGVLFDLSKSSFADVFGTQRHDLIVSEASQQAMGLFDNEQSRQTEFYGVTHSAGFKLELPVISDESKAAKRAIDLLNARVNTKLFSSNGIKFSVPETGIDKAEADAPQLEKPLGVRSSPLPVSSALSFISPIDGTEIQAGRTVVLGLRALPSSNVKRVVLSAFNVLEIDSVEPFEFDVEIPKSSALGTKNFYAVGLDENGLVLDVDSLRVDASLSLNVVTTFPLDSMIIASDKNITLGSGEERNLSIIGFFADGIRRQISWDTSTLYSSSDETVARVSLGVITAVAEGKCQIVVSRKQFVDTISVSVVKGGGRPKARRGYDTTLMRGATVSLDGRTSYSSDGTPLTFSWIISDKPSGSAAFVQDQSLSISQFTPDIAGWYSVDLIVTDESGQSDTAHHGITVIEPVPVEENTDSDPTTNHAVWYSHTSKSVILTLDHILSAKIYLSDVTGKQIYQRTLHELGKEEKRMVISTTDLSDGLYFLALDGIGANGQSLRQVFSVAIVR